MRRERGSCDQAATVGAHSPDAMRAARERISSQSRMSRYCAGGVLDHRALDRTARLRGHPATEDHVIANAEPLRPVDDPCRLQPRGVWLLGRISDGTGAEHPERTSGELVGLSPLIRRVLSRCRPPSASLLPAR